MSARDSDADFAAAMMDWRAAQEETDAALDALRDEAVRQEIARIEAHFAAHPERSAGGWAEEWALATRLWTLRRAYPHIGRTA